MQKREKYSIDTLPSNHPRVSGNPSNSRMGDLAEKYSKIRKTNLTLKSHKIWNQSSENASNILGEQQETTKVTILSLDTFQKSIFFNFSKSKKHKKKRLKKLLELITEHPEYDIIALQDLTPFLTKSRKEVILHSSKLGYKWSAYPPCPPLLSQFWINSGLLNLSKFEILESRFRPFWSGSGLHKLVYRGVLYTKIKVGGQKIDPKIIHLFNVFTQESRPVMYTEETRREYEARVNQLCTVREAIEAILGRYSNLGKNLIKGMRFPVKNERVLVVGGFHVDARANNIVPRNLDILEKRAKRYLNEGTGKDRVTEYELLLHILGGYGRDRVVDHLAKNYEVCHPVTVGDVKITDAGAVVPGDQILTRECLWKSKMCLDLIFEILVGGVVEPLRGACRVQKFSFGEAESQELGFGQISSHYGVSFNLEF